MKSKEFEDILHGVGSFGPFQVMVFIVVSLFETPAAWAMFLPVFIHRQVRWVCKNDTYHDKFNDTETNKTWSDGMNRSNCNRCPESERQYLDDFTSIVSEWNLTCDQAMIPAIVMTIQMVGMLLGAVVLGQLADIVGRRIPYFCAYFGILLMGLATAASISWPMYACCRFASGFFIGGTMVVNYVLPLEVVSPRWRTFCGCIGFWACGVMTLAPLAYFIRNWRYLTGVCALGGVPLLFTWRLIPESPRWLLVKGRVAEAGKIMTRIARVNKKPLPVYAELIAFSKAKQEQQKQNEGRVTYWDLFRTATMTKNTLIVLYAWFVSSSVYYGLSLSVGHLAGDEHLNFFLSGLVELPALILVLVINNRLGRRTTISLLMGVAGLSCFGVFLLNLLTNKGVLPADISSSVVTVVVAMLGKSGISGGWAAVQVYSAELFPTVARNVGVAASAMMGRAGGIVAPQIAAASKNVPFLPFAIFGVFGVACSLLAFLLPETLNTPLPDTLPPWQCACCRDDSDDDRASGLVIKKPVDDEQALGATEEEYAAVNGKLLEPSDAVDMTFITAHSTQHALDNVNTNGKLLLSGNGNAPNGHSSTFI